ncbi:hypothetical protein yc1106_06048 [Curvularia clavata]|uniref:Uncharacterized protein n=1 Tax=Curvularia clavata TaxID=95742 RepID=A0A9Q9DUG4_CURCL|nr:hypothetical protein yc1106_06048 [Curvularia clavata]
MSTTATRRSTRRTAAATASTEVSHTVSDHGTPPPEAPQRKGRKSKATVKAEPQTATESQQTVTKTRATSRAIATSATSTTTSTNTSSTMTAQTPAVPRKLTRASRAEIEKAGGQASPQRSLEDARPAKRARSTAPAKSTSQKRRAVTAKSAPKETANDQENEDELPPFFTTRKPHFSSLLLQPPSTETSQQENARLRVEIDELRLRVTDLESQNQDLLQKLHKRDQQLLAHESKIMRLENENFRLQHFSDVGNGPPADQSNSEFEDDIFDVPQSTPAQPVFINGTESAFALLHKIEQNARETKGVEPSVDKGETQSENNGTKELSPAQSTKRSFNDASATPTRPVEKGNILSRSFSAIKSRFFSSTPKPQPTPEVTSPTPTKALPPQNTLTETLSLPPTPVGERVKTPKKKRTPTNTMMKVLLRGVDEDDRRKAEDWAKQVIPELKSDPAFREKRKRLETPVLFKDLNSYPSAKPWETGFGDPLGDLDDDDTVPVWAVYLEMKAEEEEHAAKRHKSNASVADQEVPTIDEQFAASTTARMSPKLYNSNGHSASLHDFRPRRSVEPSPMFSNSVSHTQGSNIFSELQGHDAAAQIRENDREILKNATKATVDTQTQSSIGVTFSVPDDSDDEDSTAGAEAANTETTNTGTSGTEAAPIWTQPPPPAPVPAHAPLPGGPATDAPLSPPSQQPVAEIERQRQRLMKHTPAKPSRLREATYPSPSVLSDIGNESLLAATPAPVTASAASMFDDIPGAEPIELDAEEQAALEELMNSDEYKQKLAVEWGRPIITYESDEEELSPSSN